MIDSSLVQLLPSESAAYLNKHRVVFEVLAVAHNAKLEEQDFALKLFAIADGKKPGNRLVKLRAITGELVMDVNGVHIRAPDIAFLCPLSSEFTEKLNERSIIRGDLVLLPDRFSRYPDIPCELADMIVAQLTRVALSLE